MNKYIIIVIVVVLALTGFILWYGGMDQPIETVSPSSLPTASPSMTPISVNSIIVPPEGVKLPSPVRASSPATNQGTVTFAIKDKAESLDNFSYILLQLKGVAVRSAGGQWTMMKSTPPLFDLLKLYRSEKESAFLTEMNLDAGTYDQIRLDVGSIVLVTKDGIYHETKLPSGRITLNSHLIVEKKGLSSVTVDIIADKSIHSTGNGVYIFAPVVNLETRSKLSMVQVSPSSLVTLIGGKTDTTIDFGMDESGEMKKDFSFDGGSMDFDVLGSVIRVISREEKEGKLNLKITPQQAINTVTQGGHVVNIMSVKALLRASKWVWQVKGTKSDGGVGTVYIDVTTGAVVGME